MRTFLAGPLGLAFSLFLPVAAQAQTTIAAQGFEGAAGDTWTIVVVSDSVSSTAGAGDAPANERIRTGTRSWQVNALSVSPATLELGSVDVSGYTDVQVALHLSATSGVSANGLDGLDSVAVYVALDGAGFSAAPDLVIKGNNNAKWGYSTTVASTTAGTRVVFQPSSGGSRTGKGDDYSALTIAIPGGTSAVALKVIGMNNHDDEYWNLDDLALTGTAPTTETRVQFAGDADAALERDAGTSDYAIEVTITNPDANNPTTASVTVVGGFAIEGVDYTYSGSSPDTKTITFPAGSSASQTVTVTLNGDGDAEPDETILFEIQNVSGGNNAAAGSPQQLTLTIQNDDGAPLNAWINEFHYDNASVDENEFIEIAVPESFTDLANLELILYDGGGSIDATLVGDSLTKGSLQNGFVLYYHERPLENNMEGFALCYKGSLTMSGGTLQFISYDGFFNASVGCAAGLTSTNMGLTENSSTPAGSSLGLGGAGDDYGDFSWTTFDDPGGGSGATIGTPNASQVLPVTLASFKAVIDGEGAAVLRWKTASEQRNAGFFVEHKRPRRAASEFKSLGFVEGHGTTAAPRAYAFHAAGLATGRHVFRLRQLDFDGHTSYSTEVTVELGPGGAYRLGPAYPNPFNPQARFELQVRKRQKVHVRLYDVLGRQVQVLFEGVVEPGEVREVTLDGQGLPSGVYLYRAEGDTFSATRQVTLRK